MALAPLPVSAIQAHITIRRVDGESKWFADFTKDGKASSLPVSRKDAWNFDIENKLLVWLVIDPTGNCVIVRKKGNKKYVQID